MQRGEFDELMRMKCSKSTSAKKPICRRGNSADTVHCCGFLATAGIEPFIHHVNAQCESLPVRRTHLGLHLVCHQVSAGRGGAGSVAGVSVCNGGRDTAGFLPSDPAQPRYRWQEHGFIALQGLFLFSANYLVFYWATEILTSGVVALLFSTVVLMNIVNGALFLKSAVSLRVVLGALVGIGGVAAVFWSEVSSVGRKRPRSGTVCGCASVQLSWRRLAIFCQRESASPDTRGANQRAGHGIW